MCKDVGGGSVGPEDLTAEFSYVAIRTYLAPTTNIGVEIKKEVIEFIVLGLNKVQTRGHVLSVLC